MLYSDTSIRFKYYYVREPDDLGFGQGKTPENDLPPDTVPENSESIGSNLEQPQEEPPQQKPDIVDRVENAKKRLEDFRDKRQKRLNAKVQPNVLDAKGSGSQLKNYEKAAGKQAAKTVARQGARTAAVAGAEATAEVVGAATGPVGWAVDAGIILADLSIRALQYFRSEKGLKVLITIALFLLFLIIVMVSLSGAFNQRCQTNGSNPGGGRCYKPTTDAHDTTVLSRDGGLAAGYSIDSLDQAVKGVKELIAKHPRPGDGEVQRILTQIDNLEGSVRSGAYAYDDTHIRNSLEQYRTLVVELLGTVYPGRKAGLAKVTPMLGNKVIFTGFCKQAETDLKSLRLDENLYNLIATLGNQRTIKINCLVSEHRKYVNKAPVEYLNGKVLAHNPVCGDPAVRTGSISHHCFGIAMDLVFSQDLLDLIRSLQQQGNNHIRYINDERDANHIHIEVNPAGRT